MCDLACPFLCPFTTFTLVVGVVCSHLWRSCSQQLETDLKIEREWRQTLQNDLDRERDTVSQLSTEALQINGLKKVKERRKCSVCVILYSMFQYLQNVI